MAMMILQVVRKSCRHRGRLLCPPAHHAGAVGLPCLLLGVVFLTLGSLASAAVVSIPDVTMVPDSIQEVPINVDDAVGIAGADLIVTFCPEVVTALGVHETSLTTGFLLASSIDNTGGTITICLADATGITSGSGSIVMIEFQAVGGGVAECALHLASVALHDEVGDSLPSSPSDGLLRTCGDGDSDGMDGCWEAEHGLNPDDPSDAGLDPDNDGLANVQEFTNGTDPRQRDSDQDLFGDGEEVDLLSNAADLASKPTAGHFPDVPVAPYRDDGDASFWAFHEIEAAYRVGIVKGYDDGTYHPGITVTRDQMAVYIARAMVDPGCVTDFICYSPPDVATFPDIPLDFWAFAHIEYLVAQGVVKGFDDGLYHPELAVLRDQMAVYVARGVVDPGCRDDLWCFTSPAIPTFPDVATDFWAFQHIEYCVGAGIVRGYDDGNYHPDVAVTRDQMAVYVSRAFDLPR